MNAVIAIVAFLLAFAASLALPVWAALLLGAAVPLLIAPALAVLVDTPCHDSSSRVRTMRGGTRTDTSPTGAASLPVRAHRITTAK
ncbi:hypothetical protein [Hydrogenophilus thiooxidans]|uniref:hypothetical protein n=1 Tax=Hydrogenophilus thiooxidans TaxID=2820326 RepID=UPI001C241E00|nr:hypothetical protein [Hydrogenophilus thiooxidans]